MESIVTENHLAAGQQFPNFSLPDQHGNLCTLADFAGEPVVFYFYPKDDTSGCTAEACDFRDRLPSFGNAKVVGVSPDSIKSHAKFATKYDLPFILLADTEKTLLESLGLWIEKSMYGKKYMGVDRTTILVSGEGTIVEVWRKVKVDGHAADVLSSLNQLTAAK